MTSTNSTLSITEVSPEKGSTGVALDPVITVTFSTAMDPSVIFAGPLMLQNSGQQIAGDLACEGNTLKFTPHNELEPFTEYTVLVTTSAQDVSGNTLVRNLSYTFTTKGPDQFEMAKTSDAVTEFVRDGNRMMQIGNDLFSFGGWTAVPEQSYSDVYRSNGDLTVWERMQDAPWHGRHVFGVAKIGTTTYVLGGDNLNPQFDVWSTQNGTDWTLLSSDILGNRVFAGITAHNNYLYVVGGKDFNDVWRSADGITWEEVATNATFLNGENFAGSLASFNGKLWMVCGGGDGFAGGTFSKSVWSSVDGSTWEQEPDFGGTERSYTDVCVWDNKLWVVGGYNNTEGNTKSIWYMKKDGSWTEFETPQDYIGRHATGVAVYDNRLVITCGNYHNDAWLIRKIQ